MFVISNFISNSNVFRIIFYWHFLEILWIFIFILFYFSSAILFLILLILPVLYLFIVSILLLILYLVIGYLSNNGTGYYILLFPHYQQVHIFSISVLAILLSSSSLFILILVHIISVLVSIDPDVYLLFLVVDQLFFDFKNIWDTTIKGREVSYDPQIFEFLNR